MNSSDAVDGARCWTRADRPNTMPSCAMMMPQNSRRLVAMAYTIAGVAATSDAVTAVMARPDRHPAVDAAKERVDPLGRGRVGRREDVFTIHMIAPP